ncbi:hypothetical protein VP01_535g2 [Puccinia sorghi]|uniref:Uncharacterized protein n=1 Tax=Puccinia sorghi TaxID=27349 RepID=A0A0L6UM18_9BASI|nr:hypothetical protein VP01_535g2 [Puccinia sorghi]
MDRSFLMKLINAYSASSFICSCFKRPECIYAGQTIRNWLELLLEKIRSSDCMYDVQHGTSFKNLDWDKKQNSLNIFLSISIDWFNPRGLKIGGKTESTGPSNICLAKISPGPNSPNPQTVKHLMALHVEELIQLESGISIATHHYPNKQPVQVKLICVLVDLDSLERGAPRTQKKALKYAQKIKECRAKNSQDTLLRAYGVRCMSFFELCITVLKASSKHISGISGDSISLLSQKQPKDNPMYSQWSLIQYSKIKMEPMRGKTTSCAMVDLWGTSFQKVTLNGFALVLLEC